MLVMHLLAPKPNGCPLRDLAPKVATGAEAKADGSAGRPLELAGDLRQRELQIRGGGHERPIRLGRRHHEQQRQQPADLEREAQRGFPTEGLICFSTASAHSSTGGSTL
jgi:hypothetical protein